MDGNWYSNKELFEQLNQMQGDFKDLSHEMRETRTMIRQYNGLREKINNVETEVQHIKSLAEGKQTFGQAIREWGGWVFALITLIVLLYQF